jgi:hypothetical protein
MLTLIMHTKYSFGALGDPEIQKELEHGVMDRVRSEYPQIEWVNVFLLGSHEYLDVFRSPDMSTAMKVGALIRTLPHAHAVVWPANE